jgi:diguanylate cyclase (GGDEF)-like protein
MSVNRFRLFLNFAVPLISAAGLCLALFFALTWSAQQSDRVSVERQSQLVELIVSRMQSGIAHDQESSTVWDDAVRAVMRAEPDEEWLDQNLGSWMNTYFAHDGAFVIAPDGKLVTGYLQGSDDPAAAYGTVSIVVEPLLKTLQARLLQSDETGISDQILSIGESDITSIGARPAIVSLKPIVSDSGEVEQVPGQEFVHVAVRFLDGSFLEGLGQDYLFDGMAFSWKVMPDDGKSYAALRSRAGTVIGYFSWAPFKPGLAVLRTATPMLAGVAALLMVIMALIGIVGWRRSASLSKSRAQLERMAHHDVLTGLPNRASFSRHLSGLLAESRPERPVAVLFLDLDRFKEVNDSLGHPAGDSLIAAVADRLKEVAGPDTMMARVGGDEFTAVVRNRTREEVEALCDALVAAIRRPFLIDDHPIIIGLSVGVALSDESGGDAVELTRKADIALYHAKAAGRNRYAIFGAHMDALVKTRRDMERDLRTALEKDGQIEVHYQPVFSAKRQELKSVEALVRWRHPVHGLIAPDQFIPVAEEARLIEPLGERVLREACTAARDWEDLVVAVNASAIELRGETYALRVLAILNELGFDPRRLEIEITESALADNSGHCERNIALLRGTGVRFALDDFGTGFSSFGRLQTLDVDRIKIDKSFVEGFGKPGGNEEIVRAMIGLARAKGLQTTAEGIETAEQNEILQRLGCDHIQGYLLSRPIGREAMNALLATRADGKRAARPVRGTKSATRR